MPKYRGGYREAQFRAEARPTQVALDDLLNAAEVAAVLGLAHREAIATYRRRYDDFPKPVITKGTCVLWHRPDIEAWAHSTGRAT